MNSTKVFSDVEVKFTKDICGQSMWCIAITDIGAEECADGGVAEALDFIVQNKVRAILGKGCPMFAERAAAGPRWTPPLGNSFAAVRDPLRVSQTNHLRPWDMGLLLSWRESRAKAMSSGAPPPWGMGLLLSWRESRAKAMPSGAPPAQSPTLITAPGPLPGRPGRRPHPTPRGRVGEQAPASGLFLKLSILRANLSRTQKATSPVMQPKTGIHLKGSQ